jgi:hypothetical protein
MARMEKSIDDGRNGISKLDTLRRFGRYHLERATTHKHDGRVCKSWYVTDGVWRDWNMSIYHNFGRFDKHD